MKLLILLTVDLLVMSAAIPTIKINPQNTTTSEGQIALCDCVFNGTETVPYWLINGVSYSPTSLPTGHWSIPAGLLVTASRNSSYQCYVPYITETGQFDVALSNPAFLTVDEDDDDIGAPQHCMNSNENDANVSFGDIYLKDDQLHLEWTHYCADYCNCTRFYLVVYSCGSLELLNDFNISINCNATTIHLYNEDVVVKIVICSSTQCYVPPAGACKGNAVRINNKTNEEVRTERDQICFATNTTASFFNTCQQQSSNIVINGRKHEINRMQTGLGPYFVSETNSSIGYNHTAAMTLCIFNTNEAMRLFGSGFTLQEIASSPCNTSSNCHEECRGIQYKVLLGNETTSKELIYPSIPSECVAASTSSILISSSIISSYSSSFTTTLSMATSSLTPVPPTTTENPDIIIIPVVVSIGGVIVVVLAVAIIIVIVLIVWKRPEDEEPATLKMTKNRMSTSE